jgi:hypothetical protein
VVKLRVLKKILPIIKSEGSLPFSNMPATGPYQYSLHTSILLFQVWFRAIYAIPDTYLAAYTTLQKILLQTTTNFVFEEMATEWHKKYSECEDNITIKSKDKPKCNKNIS